jgi:hypothetical protein
MVNSLWLSSTTLPNPSAATEAETVSEFEDLDGNMQEIHEYKHA